MQTVNNHRLRALNVFSPLLMVIIGCTANKGNWYENSFYLLHEDHHTTDQFEVGRDADPEQTARPFLRGSRVMCKTNCSFSSVNSISAYTNPWCF